MQKTAKKIRENRHLLRKNTLLDFYAEFKDINRVRRAAVLVSCIKKYADINSSIQKETSIVNIEVSSCDKNIISDIEKAKNEDFFTFCKTLTSKMKEYYSYIDYFNDSLKNIFAEDPPEYKKINVFIERKRKNIIDKKDTEIQERFDRFSDLLLKKVAEPDATLMDVFFMLAYHTIDKIEFRPKEDMTELVAESLEGVADFTDPNGGECDNGYNRAEWKQHEHYIEQLGYIDRVHYFDENGEHVIELPRGRGEQFCKEELMGCYINRSNQNCSLSKDNNIIYLCKEHIEEFAFDFDNISYDEMFDLVFCHEFGHLMFSYLDYDKVDRKCSEGRANFFASYLLNMVNEKYISLIKIKTQKQPKDYREPILITQDNYISALFS